MNENITNESALILALDTSGRQGSVAIAKGRELLKQIMFTAPMKHSLELFPSILSLLKKFNRTPAEIEQVYISNGPGSFTGLRISGTFAKMMSFATQAKIVAIDTLDVIAANVDTAQSDINRLGVILDAKRGQFFTAVYEQKGQNWQKISPDSLMTAPQFLEQFSNEPISLTGEGLVYYKDKFKADTVGFLDESFWYPCAKKVHQVGFKLAKEGNFENPVALKPSYLRSPDAKPKKL